MRGNPRRCQAENPLSSLFRFPEPALLPSEAQNASWFKNDNFGAGNKSCGQWSNDKPSSVARKEDVSWVLGYLSADATRPPMAGRDLIPKDVPAEMDSICAAHPEADLREATRLLAIRHGLEPMPN
jgi:hypothetical protein